MVTIYLRLLRLLFGAPIHDNGGSTWGLKNSGMSECHFLKKNVCQNVTRSDTQIRSVTFYGVQCQSVTSVTRKYC